jgi:glycosyltransferase involved in cell wall biosynthesis
MRKPISYIGKFDDPHYEGLMSIAKTLHDYFAKSKKYKLTFNDSDEKILHIHSNGFLPAFTHRKLGSKCIYSLYSNINETVFHTLKDIWDKLFFARHFKLSEFLVRSFFSVISSLVPMFVKKNYLKKMKVVVVPTHYLKTQLKLSNSVIIPFGIDIKKFKPIHLKKKRFTVSYFGHNAPLKGIIEAIKAFGLLHDENMEMNIYLTKYSKKVANYAKKRSSKIRVFGYIKDIVKEYNKSDVIVLPYRSVGSSIGIPLALLETMSCQRAIITSNLPHIREVARDSVIYVKPYSHKQLASAIEFLKRKPQIRQKLGKHARKIVVEKYNQEKMFKAYDSLYQKF